jgi:hypothetical protein
MRGHAEISRDRRNAEPAPRWKKRLHQKQARGREAAPVGAGERALRHAADLLLPAVHWQPDDAAVLADAVSRDGRLIALLDAEGVVRVMELGTEREVMRTAPVSGAQEAFSARLDLGPLPRKREPRQPGPRVAIVIRTGDCEGTLSGSGQQGAIQCRRQVRRGGWYIRTSRPRVAVASR